MYSRLFLLFSAVAAVAVTGSAVTSQYHSQDEWGQYAYGYSGGPSAKHEQRTADGVTRGGYSYVDANGLVQSVSYVSDPINGFRAAGTNLPVETSAVPLVHHVGYAVPAPAPVPVHPWPAAVAHPEPAVVDARYLHAVPAVPTVHAVRLSQPLTPAATKNSHYPEHAAVLLARKRRSAGAYPYPLLSGYAAPAHPAHVVTVKHSEHAASPAADLFERQQLWYAAPPSPVHATSYTSVVRHDSAPAVPVLAARYPVYGHHYAPVPVQVPRVYSAHVPVVETVPVKTQYHSQDEHGQYTYGYTDGASAKTETRYADGVTKGSYSYVDDHGAVQAVHYTAGADGFQAVGTNIPVHHV